MLDTAGEAPAPRRPVAALDQHGLGVRSHRAPGHHRARRPENLARHRRRDIGRRHGAAAGLNHAPGRAAVGLGEFLDRLHEGCGIDFQAVAACRKSACGTAARRAARRELRGRFPARARRARRAPRSGRRVSERARCSRSRSPAAQRVVPASHLPLAHRHCGALVTPVNRRACAPATTSAVRDKRHPGQPRSGEWRPSRPR